MVKIFVSYARPTLAQARRIAETLQGGGHEVWIDDQLLAHRSFTDAIEEQLDAADAVLVLWSSHAAASEWVRAEASRARKAGKLLQVRVDRCSLPMPYDQIHCIDLSSWSGDYQAQPWRALLASLAAVTGEARPATPSPPQRRSAADRRSERRQVTALYCDLADSGSLAARLDPEDMMQVLDAYHAACDDIITQHGGSIAKYMGHSVLAYFGYPRGDEEEAANAVRAALVLRDAVSELDLAHGVSLRIRAGVATGQVVVSELIGGGEPRETGIVGETPNLATQLEAVAPPNGILVARTTRRITEGLFAYRDLGSVTLAGYETPVRAFEALEATEIATRSQARTQAGATPLVGRETELAQMLEAWDLARAGEGQVILIQGEAGIGKSRLVDAFRRRVADTPGVHTTWHCAPNYTDSALHPVSEQFARSAGFERGDSAETRREKLARFLERYGADGPRDQAVLAEFLGIPPAQGSPTEALTPERRKAVTLDTLLAMMDWSSSAEPALFVIEDLHWADPTTLELLDRATRRAADRSWLILATARPEFQPHWSDHADVIHIQLGRLDKGDAQRICDSLGAQGLLPASIVGEIIARSDGIPLFVEEMTKSVLEAMAAPTADGVAKVAIPNTLQDTLMARLDRLGPAKQIASLGATIGRHFSYELLAAVAPQPAADLRAALRELVKSGLIERSGAPPNSHYLFKHALIRDAAYESLLKRQREALHGRIAEVLRDRFPETRDAEPALLAYHLTESGAIAEAIPQWSEAGQRAAAQGAHLEASSHLKTALDLLRRLPADPERAARELTLLVGLITNLAAARGYSVPEIGVALSEARAICDGQENVTGLFTVLRGLSSFSAAAGDLDAAEETARRCVEIGEQTGEAAHQIEAAVRLGYVLMVRGALAAARESLERGVRLYREGSGPRPDFRSPQDPLVVCLGVLALVLDAMGDRGGAEQRAGELTAHAHALGRPFDLAFATSWRAAHHIVSQDWPQALRFAQESEEISEANGYATYSAVALSLKASASRESGDLETAINIASGAAAELERLGNTSLRGLHLSGLADLQAAIGDNGAALTTVDQAIAHALKYDDRYFLSPLYLRRARLLARVPDADPAAVAAALDQAAATAKAQGAAAFVAEALALTAPAAA